MKISGNQFDVLLYGLIGFVGAIVTARSHGVAFNNPDMYVGALFALLVAVKAKRSQDKPPKNITVGGKIEAA